MTFLFSIKMNKKNILWNSHVFMHGIKTRHLYLQLTGLQFLIVQNNLYGLYIIAYNFYFSFKRLLLRKDISKLLQMTPSQWNTWNATFGVEDSCWSWLTLMVELPFGSLDEVFWEATGPSLFMTPFLQRHYLTLTRPKAHKQAGNHCQHCTATSRQGEDLSGTEWLIWLCEPHCRNVLCTVLIFR